MYIIEYGTILYSYIIMCNAPTYCPPSTLSTIDNRRSMHVTHVSTR